MRQIGMGVSTEAKAEDIIETLKAENKFEGRERSFKGGSSKGKESKGVG